MLKKQQEMSGRGKTGKVFRNMKKSSGGNREGLPEYEKEFGGRQIRYTEERKIHRKKYMEEMKNAQYHSKYH